MKKSFAIVLGFILCLCLSACSGQETQQQTSSQLNSSQEQSDTGVDDAGSSDKVMTDTAESDAAVSLEAEEESMGRKLKLTVEGQKLSITLYDTPAANALYDVSLGNHFPLVKKTMPAKTVRIILTSRQ